MNDITEISHISREQALEILGISKPTLHRNLRDLLKALGANFPYESGSKHISIEAFNMLKFYRELAQIFNRKHAKKHIKEELIRHGYIQENSDGKSDGNPDGNPDESSGFKIKFR
jgi:hypothetical protein